MPRLAVALAAAALALIPAQAARAACAVPDLDAAPIDVIARPLPGPMVPGGGLLSPALFAVVLYQKGKGPAQIPVTTGSSLGPAGIYSLIGEGLFPHPGELWRLYGAFNAAGILQSGACNGSHTIPDAAPAPRVRIGGRSVAPVPATLLAHTVSAAPRMRVTGRALRLRSDVPLISVRSVRKDTELARGTGSETTWKLRVPAGESRVVVDTGDRVYAFGVLSRLSHR